MTGSAFRADPRWRLADVRINGRQMLQTRPQLDAPGRGAGPDTEGASLLQGIDLVSLMAMARRHLKVVAISVATCLALALAFGFLSDVKYTAQASILIGNRQIRAIQDISAQTTPAAESSLVDNQTEVLRSERVLLAAIGQLKLMDDPEFNGTDPPSIPVQIVRFIQRLNPMRLFQPDNPESDPVYRMQRTVLGRLKDAMTITRAGKSNVIQLAITAKGPKKSANIANGIATAYLADQLGARIDAARDAGDWFRTRLEELRQQSVKASAAVETYRAKNNLIATNGQLVSDQQLVQLNTDFAAANADFTRQQARYDNLKSVISSGRADSIVTEALQNPAITSLRQRLADTTKNYNELVARLGPRHDQAIFLKNRVGEYERLIFEEMRRFLTSYENDLAVARERRDALEKRLVEASTNSSSTAASLVQLRQLEQEATTLNALYQSFLQRYQETIQQESFPINDARIITDAAPPLLPSDPRMVLIAAAGIVGGLGVGGMIGAYRELSDRAFRTGDQVRDELGVEVFGVLPKVQPDADEAGGDGMANYAVRHPFSQYAETLRAVKVSLDDVLAADRAKIVGIVSSIPREGKSTVSMNLASLLALQGNRVAIIDADLREAGLTRITGLKPKAGLAEVLLDQVPLGEILSADAKTGLTVVPATVKQNAFLSSDLIASPAMEALLKSLSKLYDYVIVDLPPLGPVVDGRAVAHLLDAAILVVEWGGVSRGSVRNALTASPAVRDKLAGAVLNKVELARMRSYEPYLHDKAQEERYGGYYR